VNAITWARATFGQERLDQVTSATGIDQAGRRFAAENVNRMRAFASPETHLHAQRARFGSGLGVVRSIASSALRFELASCGKSAGVG
jgi:hypothetical protein